MKRVFLALLMFCVTASAVLAQDQMEDYWPQGGSLDFGTFAERNVERVDTLILRNPTDQPFSIENVRASCGCTAVDWPKGAVAPGEVVEIPVAFRCTKGGEVERTLDVYLSHLRGKQRIYVYASCPRR